LTLWSQSLLNQDWVGRPRAGCLIPRLLIWQFAVDHPKHELVWSISGYESMYRLPGTIMDLLLPLQIRQSVFTGAKSPRTIGDNALCWFNRFSLMLNSGTDPAFPMLNSRLVSTINIIIFECQNIILSIVWRRRNRTSRRPAPTEHCRHFRVSG